MNSNCPSENLSQNYQQTWNQKCLEWLKNRDFCHLYNKKKNSSRDVFETKSQSWFLSKCIKSKLILPRYKVTNKNQDLQTSLGWMQRDVHSLQATEIDLEQMLSTNFNNLIILPPPDLKDNLSDKIQRRGNGFQHHYKEEKVQRFLKLLKPEPNNPPPRQPE